MHPFAISLVPSQFLSGERVCHVTETVPAIFAGCLSFWIRTESRVNPGIVTVVTEGL